MAETALAERLVSTDEAVRHQAQHEQIRALVPQPRHADGSYAPVLDRSTGERTSRPQGTGDPGRSSDPAQRAAARGVVVDHAYAKDLEAAYITHMQQFSAWYATRPSELAAYRARYHAELTDILNGRQRGEKKDQFVARIDGRSAVTTPGSAAHGVAQVIREKEAADAVWSQAGQDGLVPIASLPAQYLYGYTFPAHAVDHISREGSDNLKLARLKGLSQAAVTAMVLAEIDNKKA